ncbi:hypothetical protein [Rufibacter quisquiliarum]|uniref:Uncharacterized protein n=1 Tax=Rufibacter quisquiliarum TaxID=1549639 RepID=A0A839GMC1_9BACT|nr:hypothetical protein [Rufibacter quisquiliarum]MBA9077969.1 hypothetical protein [Rufibacter quisquiliarum]
MEFLILVIAPLSACSCTHGWSFIGGALFCLGYAEGNSENLFLVCFSENRPKTEGQERKLSHVCGHKRTRAPKKCVCDLFLLKEVKNK